MKEKLAKLLNAKKEQRDALNKSLIESDNKEERAAIGETLSKLAEEIRDVEEMLASIDEPAEPAAASTEPNTEGRSAVTAVVAGMTMRNGAAQKEERKGDPYDTEEYRTAFMEFVCRGTAIPKELRADSVTATTDAGAVIPTSIMKEIIKELKSYGNLYNAVRKLNVQGGVQIPIASLKPVASWVGEGKSDAQKLEAKTSVTFNYFGLECKIAQTLLASVVTLDMFQQLFIPLATEAMAKALDIAIINGTGEGQPLGVTVDARVPSANVVTMTAADFGKWDMWKKKVFGKMKKSYRNGTFYMAQSTFDGYIDGMVDQQGQPIGRVNYGIDGAENYRFGGKTVETVEDEVIKAYDDAATGDVIAVFFNPKDYGFNNNMEMQAHKWIDRDDNTVKNQLLMICDGKLIDANGVVIVKKGAASA